MVLIKFYYSKLLKCNKYFIEMEKIVSFTKKSVFVKLFHADGQARRKNSATKIFHFVIFVIVTLKIVNNGSG